MRARVAGANRVAGERRRDPMPSNVRQTSSSVTALRYMACSTGLAGRALAMSE
ncbi:MAG: hypothetical protein ACXVFM_20145 [Solirubrobacteraceae bacterium]